MNYTIAKLIAYRRSFTCQMCYKQKFSEMYEYQAKTIVPRHKPEHFKKICGNCIYREVFGSKFAKIKKKEKVLDDLQGV
tara:strand:- start:308 stop:544 length:237 start_codon:yes stop_codon:yes gene_type:complete